MLNLFRRQNNEVINVNDIDPLLGKVKLIDIREPYEYESVSLKDSVNIPMNTLLGNPSKYLNKEDTYYIICQSGGRSAVTVSALSRNGYKAVNVAGGIGSYIGTNIK